MTTLTIKTHSESRREYEFFQAILTLAGSVLTHDWRVVESEPADVVLVSFDAVEPYSAWDEYAEKYPGDRLIAYTDESAVNGARWHIPRAPESSMPRLSDVVRVLNAVAQYFSAAGACAPPAALAGSLASQAPPVQDAVERFYPGRHLAGLIQQAIDDGQCRVCRLRDGLPVYLFPQENTAYTAAEMTGLSSLCRADIDCVEVRVLREGELREEIAALGIAKSRSLAEFLWFSILTGSNGRLLADCALDEPVHLREWPGHVRLSFYALYHDIATQMAGGLASLAEIAHRSAAPIQNVIDLHNACACQGLILRGEEARRLAERKMEARESLRVALKPLCADSNGYVKLVIVGSVGSGKTTALTALSETPPILTEANPSDGVAGRKPTTTVAMEYGEIAVFPGAKLQIYGTPGQKRFDFMGEILSGGAWGVLVLIDNTGPNPLGELKYYLEIYADRLSVPNVAVGISHYDAQQGPPIEVYEQFLYDHDYPFPVGVVDTRDIHSLAVLVAVMAESCQETALRGVA